MKKKLLYLLLLLTLVFTAGCNKKDDPVDKKTDTTPTAAADTQTPAPTATPTSTPTPTPTPLPENLAQTNLKKLVTDYNTMLANQPDYIKNVANGMGCDMSIDISVSEQLMSLVGLSDIKSLSIDGTVDYKDLYAVDMAFLLNDAKVVDFSVLTDFNNMYLNIPKYSSQYAGVTLAELLETEEALPIDMSQIPNAAEIYDMIGSYLTRFVDCFKPQTEIAKNVSIGTGDYAFTGDRHTVIASKEDLVALLEELETEFSFDSENVSLNAEITVPDETEINYNNFILSYYTNADGSYAWEILTDDPDAEPIVFASTKAGICFYGLVDGTPDILLYSQADSETEGTLYLLGDVENPDGTIVKDTIGEFEYEVDDKNFAMEGYVDTMELSVEYSVDGDVVEFEYELAAEGVAMTMKETVNKNRLEAEITLASFGMKLGTITMTADYRDYKAVSVPENAVDMETWTNGIDMVAFATDLNNLMEQYPGLQALFAPEEDPYEGDYPYEEGGQTDEPYVLPEDYTDDFMGMTGYAINADGYIDFTPLESEVLAAGKPSTGYNSIAITDTQKQSLFDLCAGLFADYYSDVETYYSVWGDPAWSVDSYYYTEYYYADNNDYNSFAFLNFDAVSGDFIDVTIYTSSSEKSIQAANDALTILGVTETITAEDIADYNSIQLGDFTVYGYFDENIFAVTIEVYEEY